MNTNNVISMNAAPLTINGQPLGGGFSFAYDLGGSTTDIANQAYNFLNANNATNQAFLGSTIAGTQQFLANQSTPLLNLITSTQTSNQLQQGWQQTTSYYAASAASNAVWNAPASYYNTVAMLADRAQYLTGQAISQIGQNTSSSNQASVSAASNSGGGGWCFITTAVCESSGKPDDCEELKILRKFRDEFMLADEERKKLVAEYYEIAPEIVRKIKTLENAGEIFSEILDRFIITCVMYIEKGCNQCALNHYVRMIETCKTLVEDI